MPLTLLSAVWTWWYATQQHNALVESIHIYFMAAGGQWSGGASGTEESGAESDESDAERQMRDKREQDAYIALTEYYNL